MSSTTSRHCLPGRKGLHGSTSSLIPCQKIRSVSVRKGTSDSGGNDGAQEMSAGARSGTIHRLRPASASLSAASLPACPLCAATRQPSMAGWGAVVIDVDASGVWRLAGGAWGPVETDPAAQLFLGASRPTSPVDEVSAIVSVLRMLPAARVSIPLTILSDSQHALGVVFGRGSRFCRDTLRPAGTERGATLQAMCSLRRQSWPGSCHARRAVCVRDSLCASLTAMGLTRRPS